MPWQDKESHSFILSLYYRERIFMGVCCISCEVLYLALYLLHWRDGFLTHSLDVRLPDSLNRLLQWEPLARHSGCLRKYPGLPAQLCCLFWPSLPNYCCESDCEQPLCFHPLSASRRVLPGLRLICTVTCLAGAS